MIELGPDPDRAAYNAGKAHFIVAALAQARRESAP
jgi:hypothetical protein